MSVQRSPAEFHQRTCARVVQLHLTLQSQSEKGCNEQLASCAAFHPYQQGTLENTTTELAGVSIVELVVSSYEEDASHHDQYVDCSGPMTPVF